MKRRALGIILTLAVLLCGVPFALLTQADTSDTAKPVLIMLEDHESLTGDGDAANAWKYEVEGDTASYGTFGYSSNGGVDGSKCVWLDYRMPYTWSFYRLDKNITVEGNGLQFWVKNTHAIKVTVEFVSNGEYVGTKQEFDLDAGQKYVSFAWADTGLTAGNTYETRLVFTYPEDHTGQIYVDNLSIYGEDTAEEMDPNELGGYYFTGRDMNRDKTFFCIEEELSGVFAWHFACDIAYTDERSLWRGVGDTVDRFVK